MKVESKKVFKKSRFEMIKRYIPVIKK